MNEVVTPSSDPPCKSPDRITRPIVPPTSPNRCDPCRLPHTQSYLESASPVRNSPPRIHPPIADEPDQIARCQPDFSVRRGRQAMSPPDPNQPQILSRILTQTRRQRPRLTQPSRHQFHCYRRPIVRHESQSCTHIDAPQSCIKPLPLPRRNRTRHGQHWGWISRAQRENRRDRIVLLEADVALGRSRPAVRNSDSNQFQIPGLKVEAPRKTAS